MDEITKLKKYLQRSMNGEPSASIAFSALETDDDKGLQILIDCGLDLQKDNFVFSAMNNNATKCFDLLLSKNANILMGGRASNGRTLLYFEPLEYACLISNMHYAQKLVEHGAPLTTQSGGDILRRYRKYIGAEGCEILLQTRSNYVNQLDNTEKM